MLFAVLAFTACFMEADSRFPWKSAYVITLLIASVILSIALLTWERHVTLTDKVREPVLPWRFFTNRVMIGILLVIILVGAPMGVTTFQLPQRFQLVNGLSSLDVGIRLLPFGAVFPVGCMAGTIIAGKFKVPAIYLIFVGSIFQIIGYALLSTLSTSAHIETAAYGYLIICGFGCGLTFTMVYITAPFTADLCDKAVGMASANQFWAMGSAIGLAIVTSVFNGYILSHFADLGIDGSMTDLITGQLSLPQSVREDIRHILSEAYNRAEGEACTAQADIDSVNSSTGISVRDPIEVSTIGNVDMGLRLLRYLVFEESLRKSDMIAFWPIAIVDLLSSFGVASTAVIGYSSGEIAAAYTTGSISHKYGCKMAYFRGKGIKKLRAMTETPGTMIAANIPEPKVPAYLAKLDLGS
ncbi:hypothetical protein BOTCAL_0225g00020 [Botryotinia calthae]|uniref:Malonyl-CoA:ACP transacylase (MAT) domain-containing protein n=1 Tax=Botryotinia calthae TaxID=38488 RepID=A0A4Y8CYI9_9HELO|nr:hypothetical protein BOTCAL_0225g00020 [Botryotinia calthae]